MADPKQRTPSVTYRISEIVPARFTVEPRPDGLVRVRNEYGREMFSCEDTPLSLADWRAFFTHIGRLAEARGWLDSLTRAAQRGAS